MSISIDEVNRIAKLARLNFNEDEKPKLQRELSSILDYVGQLKEVQDKAGKEDLDPDAVNLMRDDIAQEFTPPEEFLRQAPDRQGNFIKVKSVLD